MAAVLPRKIAAGSRPVNRSASSTPSENSTEMVRWVIRIDTKRMASQKSPGAASSSTRLSGSNANPKSTTMTSANGSTWVQGDPRLPLEQEVLACHQRRVTNHGAPRPRATGRLRASPSGPVTSVTMPPSSRTTSLARGTARSSSCEAIRTVAPTPTASTSRLVQQITSVGVEAGVGFVEQPQLGPARHHRGQRNPPPLAGRQPVDGDVRAGGRPTRRGSAPDRHPPRWRRRPGPRSRGWPGRVRSSYRKLAWPSRPTRRRMTRRSARRSWPSTDGLALHHRDQPSAGAQECCLAGAVGTDQQDNLTRGDIEIDAGEGRKPSEHAHGGAEVDHSDPWCWPS